ncbi:AAA family ATPase [Nitratiruptor tergarcus]|uniref:AAA+-type ATPase, SpoVK/Ycf46/Vps4 family n=1 Tax=Nitratiruptor tergarcus DSM 16512 TaxID=1069081 RepID=A0A1W1WUS4_9BACT|nr:ATP-binding protein [Nitratiruptor tergarcus]SMC10068.1 AAA+-type ATPase, SpoVK/Ycf46/Vps4 family [Nitratiruptor tergarcus DSM 16512]
MAALIKEEKENTLEQEKIASIRYWVANILYQLDLIEPYVTLGFFRRPKLASVLGMKDLKDESEKNPQFVIERIQKVCHEIIETTRSPYPSNLEKNVASLYKTIDLTDTEQEILKFAIIMDYSSEIQNALFVLEEKINQERSNLKILSLLLELSEKSIKKALSPNSTLSLSGLITIRYRSSELYEYLDPFSSTFVDIMVDYENDDVYDLFKDAIRRVSSVTLTYNDFSHISHEIQVLRDFLSSSIKQKRIGTNILIYGKPGTGKTELAKFLAKILNVELFEVSYADKRDEPINGKERIAAYKVAQYLFGQKSVMLLFDEIEDVFDDIHLASAFLGKRPTQENKGWINHILEKNRVPTVWISNSIDIIDPAIIRRFDLVIHMPVPPRSKRKAIAEQFLGKYVSKQTINIISEHENIAPATISKASNVLDLITNQKKRADKEAHFIISSMLEAQGHKPLSKLKNLISFSYNPAYINTTIDLEHIAQGIAENPNARICLYGPPGTGKSAFGKWLANRLDRPFIVKKGSDLLSMWVGGTEKNIANAFQEAEKDDAVLIFDEIDGLLQDRHQAHRSWEVTQVNELLTQMEAFEGIFIATTNLMENLDQASLRRFDLKLHFDYMRLNQAKTMFIELCQILDLKSPDNDILCIVASLRNLTPGDFAAVLRQNRFHPIKDAEDFAKRLQEEVMMKNVSSNIKMGFVAS